MAHNVTIRFDFSDTSKYASIPLYIGVSATFTTIFIYIQSELSPLSQSAFSIAALISGSMTSYPSPVG